MEKLLITLGTVDYNTTAVAGSWELTSLTNGELLCMDQDGTAVDMLLPAITTDELYFAVGRTTVAADTSVMIDIQSLEWSKQAYVAPVAKIMYIGDDTSSVYGLHMPTPIAGDVASVRITDKTKEHFDAERVINVEYVVQDGDTEANVQTGIVAAIVANARAAAVVTAAVASTTVGNLGFTLTGVTAGEDFTATPGGILEDADVLQYQNVNGAYSAGMLTPTAIVIGYGTAAQLTATESAYSTHDGNNNSNLFRGVLYSNPTNVVVGATYTTYTLTWRKHTNKKLVNETNVIQTLVIAIPSGETGAAEDITAMDNILASL